MSRTRSAFVLAVVVALLATLATVSGAAVIDFDALAPGTVVTNQFPGVTFSTIPGYEIRVIPLTVTGSSAPNVIGTYNSSTGLPSGAEAITIDFDRAWNLSFVTVADDNAGVVGSITVHRLAFPPAVVNLLVDGDSSSADLQDLNVYLDVTKIVIDGITDLNGLGFETFSGTRLPVELLSFSVE